MLKKIKAFESELCCERCTVYCEHCDNHEKICKNCLGSELEPLPFIELINKKELFPENYVKIQ